MLLKCRRRIVRPHVTNILHFLVFQLFTELNLSKNYLFFCFSCLVISLLSCCYLWAEYQPLHALTLLSCCYLQTEYRSTQRRFPPKGHLFLIKFVSVRSSQENLRLFEIKRSSVLFSQKFQKQLTGRLLMKVRIFLIQSNPWAWMDATHQRFL